MVNGHDQDGLTRANAHMTQCYLPLLLGLYNFAGWIPLFILKKMKRQTILLEWVTQMFLL